LRPGTQFVDAGPHLIDCRQEFFRFARQ
jgi:hypothetical protein